MLPIVITGGPCAGKTSALSFLRRELEDRHFTPILVPECATALIAAGIAPWSATRLGFQTAVFELQLAQEEAYGRAAARMGERCLQILDRGLMDGLGYLSDEEFAGLLEGHGITEDAACARYGAVFHLESTAKGFDEAYTLANNASRMEEIEEALQVEERILKAWAHHPARYVIHNQEHFEEKCENLLKGVLAYLGQ